MVELDCYYLKFRCEGELKEAEERIRDTATDSILAIRKREKEMVTEPVRRVWRRRHQLPQGETTVTGQKKALLYLAQL